MNDKPFGIIYKATFPNGKCYVGQTVNSLEYRKKKHLQRLVTENTPFHRAIQKYGKDNVCWEVIDTAKNIDNLNEKEIYWIDIHKSYIHSHQSNGYNLTLGGGGSVGYIPTPETLSKLSALSSGENNPMYGKTGEKSPCFGRTGEKHPMYGKHHTEESRARIRASTVGQLSHMYGTRLSEETKAKIGNANRGRQISEETRTKMAEANSGEKNGMFGKQHSEEAKQKISEANRGKHPSAEARQKMSESHSGSKNPNFGKHVGLGRNVSDETRKKLSEAAKLRWRKAKEQQCLSTP